MAPKFSPSARFHRPPGNNYFANSVAVTLDDQAALAGNLAHRITQRLARAIPVPEYLKNRRSPGPVANYVSFRVSIWRLAEVRFALRQRKFDAGLSGNVSSAFL
jgi:hypothetical protein